MLKLQGCKFLESPVSPKQFVAGRLRMIHRSEGFPILTIFGQIGGLGLPGYLVKLRNSWG